jgi:hypothetical protein
VAAISGTEVCIENFSVESLLAGAFCPLLRAAFLVTDEPAPLAARILAENPRNLTQRCAAPLKRLL